MIAVVDTLAVSRSRRSQNTRGRARAGSPKQSSSAEPSPVSAEPVQPSSSAILDQRSPSGAVAMLTSPVGTAFATAASFVGLLLSLAPVLGTTTVLTAIGLPTFAWGVYQLVLKSRSPAVRVVGAVGAAMLLVIAAFFITQRIAEPATTEFFYDGSLLTSSKRHPLAGEPFPVLTDDPAKGREVDVLAEPSRLVVSCWVNGHYKGENLTWVAIVRGDYRTLWVPLSSLGAMGRGAVRTILPCSDWRWKVQDIL